MKKIIIASLLLLGAVAAYYYFKWGRITITKVDPDARTFDYKMETANNTVTGTKKFDEVSTSQIIGREGFFVESIENGFMLQIENLNGWTKQTKFFNTQNT